MTQAIWDFRGQVVLISGGTKGIGRGIAERFLQAGADVMVCGRQEPESLPTAHGRSAAFLATDLRDAEQSSRLVEHTCATLGRLDVLVNNAGGAPPADTSTVSPRFSAAIIALNLTAPLVLAQRANAIMQTQAQGGTIINVASVSGLRASPRTAAYGAAKAGLLNLTETLAVEWAPRVRVNAVTPGLVETEQSHLHYGDPETMQRIATTIPMGRMALPGDIADVCLFLASPWAQYVTGANIVLHGGGERPAYLSPRT